MPARHRAAARALDGAGWFFGDEREHCRYGALPLRAWGRELATGMRGMLGVGVGLSVAQGWNLWLSMPLPTASAWQDVCKAYACVAAAKRLVERPLARHAVKHPHQQKTRTPCPLCAEGAARETWEEAGARVEILAPYVHYGGWHVTLCEASHQCMPAWPCFFPPGMRQEPLLHAGTAPRGLPAPQPPCPPAAWRPQRAPTHPL